MGVAALLAAAPVGAQPSPPRYVREPQVYYPFTMLERGIEGQVTVAVVVGRDGRPKDMWIAQSSGHASFDNEAMNALRLAVWTPSPDERQVMVPINFVIKK